MLRYEAPMKNLAVIVLNWNGEKYIEECLSSFSTQSYTDYDLFFVDNGSTDKSLAMAKKHESIKIIETGENLGFAGGNNVAIKQALKYGYKYIALINPDTVLTKDTLAGLVNTISTNKNVGAVQSKILLHKTRRINTFGNDLHYLGFSYCGNYNQPDKQIKTHEITIASGAAVIFRATALETVGLLDDDFFMYQEDADLSWRLWEAGYTVLVSESSTIFHKYNFSRNKNKFFYFERNRLLLLIKNYDVRTLVILSPAILITELLMIVYSMIGGWLPLKLKSYGSIFKLWPETIKKRREIMATKTVRDSILKREWVTDLVFEEVSNPLFVPLNLFFRLYWLLFGWLV
jgi:GT2 family glycosyltransferase